jgi:NADPH-dependent glutamate synthase beta subunit-like oxidoreductase
MRTVAIKNRCTQPFERALEKIVENVPLPIVTTLVCFHPERAGLNTEGVIKMAEKVRSERIKKEKRRKTMRASGEKVAIIGSGPAGLTVAYELARQGHKVTMFEAFSEPGGMLLKGIPECRLPKEILAKEIQIIKDSGVEIKNGMRIGKDLDFNDLWKEGFKAVFVGAGANKSQELKIDGRDLKGVIHATEFLWEGNCGGEVEVGKSVVVIGGGNVAMDAARSALRLGAGEVTVLYRRSREEMPAIPWEIKEAEGEGVKIEFLVSPKKFLEDNGKVSAVECLRVQLGEPDESGRRRPNPIEGSEFVHKADMVILAVGEAPDLEFLPREIELNEDGTVWVNPLTMETSVEGIFAGGDAVTGPATVIEAVCAGKRAAKTIGSYLKSLGE